MPKFTGTKKEWQIVVRAISTYIDTVKFDKGSLPSLWNESWEDVRELFMNITYEKEDK